jgi:hypothetical protein
VDRPQILETASTPLLTVAAARQLPPVAGIGWDHPDARPKAVEAAVVAVGLDAPEPEVPMAGVMAMVGWRTLVGWTDPPVVADAPAAAAVVEEPRGEVAAPNAEPSAAELEALLVEASASESFDSSPTQVRPAPTAPRTVRTDESDERPGQIPAELAEARPHFHSDRLADSGIVLDGMQGYAVKRMIGRFTVTQLDGMRLGVRTRELVELLGVLKEAGVLTYSDD